MTAWASLNGVRVVSGNLTIPYFGLWVADVVLTDDTAITSDGVNGCALVVGNMTLAGAVVRTDVFAGSRMARIVGGAGGWLKPVASRAYHAPLGLKLPISLVLLDAASEVGESVKIHLDSSVGTDFVRENASAQRTLNQVTNGVWWVDSGGTTHTGNRSGSDVNSPYSVLEYDGGRGQFQIATESPADWTPGNTFSSPLVTTPQTISTVTHTFKSNGIARIDVLTMQPGASNTAPNDRLIAAIRALIRTELPKTTFLGIYEYSMQDTDGVTVDASPVNRNIGLPDITKVPIMTGLAGGSCKPKAGSTLAIGFLNGDQSRPTVMGVFDGSIATSLTLLSTLITLGTGIDAIALASRTEFNFAAIQLLAIAISTYATAIQSVADPSHSATPSLNAAISTFNTLIEPVHSLVVKAQ